MLEGYRRWLAGYDSGSVTPWEMTQTLYEELLGAAEGRRVRRRAVAFRAHAAALRRLSAEKLPV